MSNTVHEERLELPRTISTDILGIDQLEQTGKLAKDLRIVRIEDLARALRPPTTRDRRWRIAWRAAATTIPGQSTRFFS
jgi:hypothetical protein